MSGEINFDGSMGEKLFRTTNDNNSHTKEQLNSLSIFEWNYVLEI